MINLSALSRRLDLPYQNLLRLVQRGELIPDARAGKINLFREESVTRVEAVLADLLPTRFPRPQAKDFSRGRVLS